MPTVLEGVKVAGAVLAGGRSRRMGTDKAVLEVGGRAMALRVADALVAGGCDPVWCQGGDAAALGRFGATVVADDQPGEGPVPAILTSVEHATAAGAEVLVVAACDLVDLDAATVRGLVQAVGGAGARAAVAVTGPGHDRHHLVSAWTAACAAPLGEYLAAGRRSYRGALDAVRALAVPVEPGCVRNVNRPGDLPSADRRPDGYPPQGMSVQEIHVDALAGHLAAGGRLFDVREPVEFEQARVAEAVLVPLAQVEARAEEFRGDGPAYVICRSGARSMTACRALAARGIEAINIAGGTLAWIDSGRDVVSGPA